MKKFFCLLIFINFSTWVIAQDNNIKALLEKKKVLLPNGWTLTPAGRSLEAGDLPLNMAISSSKKMIAVTNNGQSLQSIQLIDAVNERLLDKIEIPKSFYGLKFSSDDKYLYAAGGNDNWILKYAVTNNKLVLNDSIILGKKWPEKISPVGIEVDDVRNILYTVTKENNSLYVIDLKTKKIINKLPLGNEAYKCILSPDKNELFISLWGGKKVVIFNTINASISDSINVSFNPNEIILTKNGQYLFVANAGDNSVSIINTKTKKTIEVLDAALYPGSPVGSVTNGLALSEDEKTLYIANADNNALSVFNVSNPGKSLSKGFIPVGWYPTNVKVIGKKIFVTNGKGFSSFANPQGPQPVNKEVTSGTHIGESKENTRLQYIGSLMKGTISIVNEPDQYALAIYSQYVYKNTPYKKQNELSTEGESGNPIPMKVGGGSPIKYVFYILKENRTYDQVFGDIREGNGDTSLCLFGEKYTPNQHKLAKEYVLLDNFFVDAEVSADGHNWSMGAHANDYLEKTWPTSYGKRGGATEGMGRRQIANDKDGFIWDFCKKANVSYRTYGVFQDNEKANIPALRGQECSYFSTFYLNQIRDTTRFQQWKKDFDSLVAIQAVPHFNSVRFGADHTQGLAVGKPSPFACVADNDLAVGLFVEHLSKSPIWNESAVFILEDDAQNGPDHVDAHRSNALVISPYTKRKFVDHTMYSTSGMLRTMELILALPPMSQYDAAATPMWRSFTAKPDFSKYSVVPSNIDLNETNKNKSISAIKSEQLDFTEADKINDHLFNEILWKGIKGETAQLPAPRRSAFVRVK
ncbi:MAG: bifunctional YncE family protein/alkaline phosphatase family protein [Chitinophagaceae bacterium]|nr:bifunctional YncE family protein/alkaline phosphatase family protein [Chitinophagaceae bacterium]